MLPLAKDLQSLFIQLIGVQCRLIPHSPTNTPPGTREETDPFPLFSLCTLPYRELHNPLPPPLLEAMGAPPRLWIGFSSRINPVTHAMVGHALHLTATTIWHQRGDRPSLHFHSAHFLAGSCTTRLYKRPQKHHPACGSTLPGSVHQTLPLPGCASHLTVT